jgi:hypothetical protein
LETETDVLVVGGGLGGVAGALAALRLGRRVVLTEETDWIGGQLTTQAVPPDEHPWIEEMGCTASYRRLRDGIRDFYRRNYPLTAGARDREHLNPGDGLVSRLCHEPRVALAVLEGILACENFSEDLLDSDITLVNWPQIDYRLGPLVGVGEAERHEHLRRAWQLSLSMLYWMQTEAHRLDGGAGYRGLRLRPDIVGTTDGLARRVYVRESRRIKAEFTVLEQHLGVEARGGSRGAQYFHDSVGIGAYRIDLHPSAAARSYVDVSSWPFQIPLGALIPLRVSNLLPACKNLGTTHIANGCYRLHPVEWNVGEASGALAAYYLDKDLVPKQVRDRVESLEDFQRLLADVLGFELAWPEPQRYETL